MHPDLQRVFGLEYGRIQFTPDVLPSDINGFSMYNRATEGFEYVPGILTQVNLLLSQNGTCVAGDRIACVPTRFVLR